MGNGQFSCGVSGFLVATEVDLVVVVAAMEVRLRVLGWSPLLMPHQLMLAMMSTIMYVGRP